MKNEQTRRDALVGLAAGTVAAVTATRASKAPAAGAGKLKGNVKLGVTRGFGRQMPIEEFLAAVKPLGIQSLDLVGPDDWAAVHRHGLAVSMGSGAGKGLRSGFNDPGLHDELVADYESLIPKAGAAGVANLICFSGNRNGLDDETGMKNCARGLKRLMPLCEEHGVTLAMELLNSKVNHKGYMADHTAWGVELSKMIGSERFKLLYDIYHMQIMEGDLIRTIQESVDYIADFHLAGNPGRHEPDETQEVYYPAVIRAILETGYEGYVVFEYGSTMPDRLESLRKSIAICDV